MSLELIAISEALSYVNNKFNVKIVAVCTDSKSFLQHIARCASGFRGASIAYVILSKIHELNLKVVQLSVQCVPSHIGIQGNEKTDMLTKYAAKNGKEYDLIIDHYEYLPKLKNKCYFDWKEHFDKRSLEKGIWFKTIQCQPLRVTWCMNSRLNRKLIVIGRILRYGHIPRNKFLHMMKKTALPDCEVCGVVEDLYHLLMECVRYDSSRNSLMSDLNLNRADIGMLHKMY